MLLENTWFVLSTSIQYVSKQKSVILLPFDKKIQINSQLDRSCVAQQTTLKDGRLKSVADIMLIT